MSVFTYNGVTLPYPDTTNFKMEAVFDPSGTDRIYTKYDISVQCILNVDYLAAIDPELAATTLEQNRDQLNAASIIAAIRNKLLKPRQQLEFSFNGIPIIPKKQRGNSGTVDAKNGPVPQNCTVMRLHSNTFVMTYSITAHYWEDPLFDINGNILENSPGGTALTCRWSESVDVDDCLASIRTREGFYIIRSDNTDGVIADEIRDVLIPLAIPSGFLRQSSSYTVDQTGLRINFKVIDREYFRVPPKPAYVAEGKYIETTTHKGALRFGQFNVKLKGTPDANRTHPTQLLATAMRLVIRKLLLNGAELFWTPAGRLTLNLLDFFTCEVDMWTNSVSVEAKCRLNAARRKIGGIPFPQLGAFVFLPSIDAPAPPVPPPAYPIRGVANLIIQAANYFNPNSISHPLSSNDLRGGANFGEAGLDGFQFTRGKAPGTAGRSPEV